MLNPAKKDEALNSPIERANDLNDPKFENQQGYYPYDLSHTEYITPLFGQATPSCFLDTIPGDRVVMRDNIKLIRNQINGNLLSTINMYSDSFYVPLRNVIPTNYEKIIPNPVKGDDIPNSALPQVPLFELLIDTVKSLEVIKINGEEIRMAEMWNTVNNENFNTLVKNLNKYQINYFLDKLMLLTTVISRGQLLDYLGFQLDFNSVNVRGSKLQKTIDTFLREVYNAYHDMGIKTIYGISIDPSKAEVTFNYTTNAYSIITTNDDGTTETDLSLFRDAISSIFEAGKMPFADFDIQDFERVDMNKLNKTIQDLLIAIDYTLTNGTNNDYILTNDIEEAIKWVDQTAEPFADGRLVNIGKILAYQQVIAHYYTNDHVDNVFSSELFMQNLRSVMYPTVEGEITTNEPVFLMNGVRYEYDYISFGGFVYSLLNDNIAGKNNRQWIWMTLMLLCRRTLKYGDYFGSSRPNMLAVSDQLNINVEDGTVSPIDVTKNLLLQRFLNASNYVGMSYLRYMSSLFGVRPSDTGCTPRFISHRKITLNNQITNNTAQDQGAQTTNLVGYSDDQAFDVFIDDFGYLITIQSYDTLPIYTSGIDSSYHFADRFDFFNPMLQNIGDQAIRATELIGFADLYGSTFGYAPRNAEYKYKISKAHGAFCTNELAGYMIKYPLETYATRDDQGDIIWELTINPDFIRDKPIILDPVLGQQTGVSPAEYWHFVVSCFNEIHCARKIQALPSILF